MTGVAAPRWAEWRSVTAPTTVVFAAKSMFSPAEQAEFIAARPGTRHVVLARRSHTTRTSTRPRSGPPRWPTRSSK